MRDWLAAALACVVTLLLGGALLWALRWHLLLAALCVYAWLTG